MLHQFSDTHFLKSFSNENILDALWQTAYHLNLPIAIWKLPNQNEQHLLIGYTFTKNIYPFTEQSGFAICPFINSASQSCLIPANCYYSSLNQSLFFLDEKDSISKKIIAYVKIALLNFNDSSTTLSTTHTIDQKNKENEAIFTTAVRHAIQEIKKNNYQKIVLSRQFIQPTTSSNPILLFQELSTLYPSTFNSLTYTPEYGTWLGASPELLLSINEKNNLETIALAGTQQKKNEPITKTRWSKKEIEEQDLVSTYIIDCFKKTEIKKFEVMGPETSEAGNILHLKTTFSASLQEDNHSNINALIQLLHPTPAVCGIPKKEALSFILQHEHYPRKLYSGFLGPVNMNNTSSLFVNLRCMKIENQNIILHAGAGITEESIPENELDETTLKLDTLLRVLNKSL